MTDFNAQIIEEFRQNGGVLGGPLTGVPVLLLTHKGARTGTVRTTPLGYFEDDAGYVLYASNMGSPKRPDWYFNVLANSDVEIECGAERLSAVATELPGDDDTGLRARVLEARPFLVDHAASAGHDIPLIVLQRA